MRSTLPRLLALTVLLALAAPAAAQAQPKTYFPGYPLARLPLQERPANVKFGAGMGWSRLQWSSWGGSEAVGSGLFVDHPGIPGGVSLLGTVRLWRPVACGPLRVYTRFNGRLNGGRRNGYATGVVRYAPAASTCRLGFPQNLAQQGPADQAGRYLSPQARPERIHLTLDSGLLDLRWSSWGGATATATGRAVTAGPCQDDPYESCKADAAVRVTLSDLGFCNVYPPFIAYRRIAFPAGAAVLGESRRSLVRVCG